MTIVLTPFRHRVKIMRFDLSEGSEPETPSGWEPFHADGHMVYLRTREIDVRQTIKYLLVFGTFVFVIRFLFILLLAWQIF